MLPGATYSFAGGLGDPLAPPAPSSSAKGEDAATLATLARADAAWAACTLHMNMHPAAFG